MDRIKKAGILCLLYLFLLPNSGWARSMAYPEDGALRSLYKAIDVYHEENGVLPDSWDDLENPEGMHYMFYEIMLRQHFGSEIKKHYVFAPEGLNMFSLGVRGRVFMIGEGPVRRDHPLPWRYLFYLDEDNQVLSGWYPENKVKRIFDESGLEYDPLPERPVGSAEVLRKLKAESEAAARNAVEGPPASSGKEQENPAEDAPQPKPEQPDSDRSSGAAKNRTASWMVYAGALGLLASAFWMWAIRRRKNQNQVGGL